MDYVNLFIKNVNTYIETVSYSEISHLKSIDINDLKSSPCIGVIPKEKTSFNDKNLFSPEEQKHMTISKVKL